MRFLRELQVDELEHRSRALTGPITRVLPFLVGAFAAWIALSSWTLGVGRLSSPGPGFWPFFVSLITLLICLALLIPGIPIESVSRGSVIRTLALACLFFISWLLLEPLGFFVAVTLLTFGMCTFIAQMNWLKSMVVSVMTSALTFFVFATLLGVRLPTLTPWI